MKELLVSILIVLISVPCFASPAENPADSRVGDHLSWDGENMVLLTPPQVQLKIRGIDYLLQVKVLNSVSHALFPLLTAHLLRAPSRTDS